ncbi:hypothetical protein DSM110277_03739 (plasmid) [Sulfitobacter pontiacus]|uniref:Uncharacterized protein n=1 Tax=Sulfitobacter pontiacus TaxID=60137 RepID=A0AAX3AHM6_9RHOB|nr:hypothetical protein DSM110277_03739 [Sulfitobacter pontiacus]
MQVQGGSRFYPGNAYKEASESQITSYAVSVGTVPRTKGIMCRTAVFGGVERLSATQ